MKIKRSHVTNSSSTGYILSCRAVGTYKIDEKESSIISRVFNVEDNNYGRVRIRSIIKNDWDSDESDESYIKNNNISIDLTKIYDDRDSIKTLVDIKTKNLDNNKQQPITLGLKNIIEAVRLMFIEKKLKKFEMLFHQTAEEYGDGWNGGDPMGYYKDSKPFFKKISKIGTIVFKSNDEIEVEIISIDGKKENVKYED